MDRRVFHIFSILIIFTLLVYYFFFVGRFLEVPWYRTADADAQFAGQTLTLLNDGDLTYLHHPGAGVYATQAWIHRILAVFDQDQRELMRLSEEVHLDPITLLATVVQTGRVISLFVLLGLAATIYFLILKITRQWLIAFIFTFFIILSKAMLRHVGIIRPEIFSILFFYLAVLLYLTGFFAERRWFSATMLTLSGLGLGMAIFSKIQIAAAIAISAPLIIVLIWISTPGFLNGANGRNLQINAGLTLLNLLITPFWALTKPDFLTPELFMRMDPNNQAVYGRYGAEPANFWLPILVGQLLLLGLAFSIRYLSNHLSPPIFRRLFSLSLIANLLVFGVILSSYIILLPISYSWEAYTSNTNQLLYSTLTNLSSGGRGYLTNAQWSFVGNIKEIIGLHQFYSPFASINPLFIAGFAALICLVRLVTSNRVGRYLYLLPIYLFLGGFAIDQISMLRLNYAYSIYAAYTVVIYGLGLAIFTWLEIKDFSWPRPVLPSAFGLILFVAGVINLVTGSYFILFQNSPVKSGDYKESDALSWINVFVPQLNILDHYPRVRRQACLTPENLEAGLGGIRHVTDQPFALWDLRETDSPKFRNSRTGRLGLRDLDISPDGFPIFSAQSGGVYLEGRELDQISQIPEGIGDVTLMVWVKILNDPNRSEEWDKTYLIGYNNNLLNLFIINTNSIWTVNGYYGGGEVSGILDHSFGSLWTQMVLTQSGKLLKLYLDGVQAGEVVLETDHVHLRQLPGINLWAGSRPARFEVASVALWPKSLSDSEISELFQRQLWGQDFASGNVQVWDGDCLSTPRELLRAVGESRR